MAAEDHLLCIECREYLSFGKVFWVEMRDGIAIRIPHTCQGAIGMHRASAERDNARYVRVVESFLIKHRNHELRFAPEGVDELLSERIGQFRMVDPENLLVEEIAPDPNSELELDLWKDRSKGYVLRTEVRS